MDQPAVDPALPDLVGEEMKTSMVIAVAIGLALPTLAQAQGVGRMCHVRSICSGISPGGGRILSCLARHRGELSVSCKVALAERLVSRSGHRGRGRMAGARGMGDGAYGGGGGYGGGGYGGGGYGGPGGGGPGGGGPGPEEMDQGLAQ